MKIMLRHKVWFWFCLGYTSILCIYIHCMRCYLALVFVFAFAFVCLFILYIILFFFSASSSLWLFLNFLFVSSSLLLLMSLRPPAVCHIEHISNRKWQKELNAQSHRHNKKKSCTIAIKRGKANGK